MEINPISIAASFSELVKVEFGEFDISIPTEGENLIATELMKKLKEIMCDFILDEDHELIQG